MGVGGVGGGGGWGVVGRGRGREEEAHTSFDHFEFTEMNRQIMFPVSLTFGSLCQHCLASCGIDKGCVCVCVWGGGGGVKGGRRSS